MCAQTDPTVTEDESKLLWVIGERIDETKAALSSREIQRCSQDKGVGRRIMKKGLISLEKKGLIRIERGLRGQAWRITLTEKALAYLRQKPRKSRKELEGYLGEHARNIIDHVLLKWVEEPSKLVAMIGTSPDWSTRLAISFYNPGGGSKKYLSEEPTQRPDLTKQAIEHLSNNYEDIWQIWVDAKKASIGNVDRVIKLWEKIESKIQEYAKSSCPSLSEWNGEGDAPEEYYDLLYCVQYIWGESKRLVKAPGKVRPLDIRKEENENYLMPDSTISNAGYLQLGVTRTYARCRKKLTRELDIIPLEKLRAILEYLVNEIDTPTIQLSEEKAKIDEQVCRFEEELRMIATNYYEPPHKNLEGTCLKCKEWCETLYSLTK